MRRRSEDLDELRAAAQGVSLQSYLRETMHGQATYLRRQSALNRMAARLAGQSPVPYQERRSVLDAVVPRTTNAANSSETPNVDDH